MSYTKGKGGIVKRGIRTSIDWSLVGAELAQDDDCAQVEFFKAFLKECQTYGTRHQTEMQLITISNQLTDEEKDLVQTIGYKGDD